MDLQDESILYSVTTFVVNGEKAGRGPELGPSEAIVPSHKSVRTLISIVYSHHNKGLRERQC